MTRRRLTVLQVWGLYGDGEFSARRYDIPASLVPATVRLRRRSLTRPKSAFPIEARFRWWSGWECIRSFCLAACPSAYRGSRSLQKVSVRWLDGCL